MTQEELFETIKQNLIQILPDLDPERITPQQSMKDLGANSIDRMDVILQTMEELRLKFPLHELGGVENLQGLVDFLHAKCRNRAS